MQYLYCTLAAGNAVLMIHLQLIQQTCNASLIVVSSVFLHGFMRFTLPSFTVDSFLFIFTVPYYIPFPIPPCPTFHLCSLVTSPVSHDVLVALLILCRVILFMFDADGFVLRSNSSKTLFHRFHLINVKQSAAAFVSYSFFFYSFVCLPNSLLCRLRRKNLLLI